MASILLLGVASGSVFAADDGPLFPETKTRYQVLAERFAEGTAGDEAKLSGWHSGRCYLETAQDNVFGSLLVFYNKPTPQPNLVLITSNQYEWFYTLDAANTYDPGHILDTYVTRLQEEVTNRNAETYKSPSGINWRYNIGPLVRVNEQWQSEQNHAFSHSGNAGFQKYVFELKIYNDYFIVKTTPTYQDNEGLKGQRASFCYYFNPITAKDIVNTKPKLPTP